MFKSISYTGLAKSQKFAYAANVPYFKSHRSTTFKPGLNILFGPNGSGKSTLLKMLGMTMCAVQGGISDVSETSLRDTVDMPFRSAPKDAIGLKVLHDGQPVMFCDPRQAVGLVSGAFDDDFMMEGVVEAMSGGRTSHGHNAARRMEPILGVLIGKLEAPKEIRRRFSRGNVNDRWAAAIDILEERMKGSLPPGQLTILLDEPEANFSLQWQSRLWKLLGDPEKAKHFQLIVASHSAFSLAIPGAHYIEMESGYVSAATEALRDKAKLILGLT